MDKVLIVDDDYDIVQLISRLLQCNHYEVLQAYNGREALDVVKEHLPEVVLLDYMMPDLNGLEVLREINKNYKETFVIIITGEGNEEVAVKLMKEGAKDYIIKPFENKNLVETVQNVLKIRKTELANVKLNQELITSHTQLMEAKEELEKLSKQLEQKVKERTKRLEKLEKKYRDIFENASDGIFQLDKEGKVIVANRRMEEITGYERNTLTQMKFDKLIIPGQIDSFKEVFRDILIEKKIVNGYELKILNRKGKQIYVEINFALLKEGKRVIGTEAIMRDITERKELEKKVNKLQERAIIAGMSRHLSHVIMNSLTSAGGFTRILHQLYKVDKESSKYFQTIENQLDNIGDVIKGYNDYVSTQYVKPEKIVNICELFEGMVKEITSKKITEKGMTYLKKYVNDFSLSSVKLMEKKCMAMVDADYIQMSFYYLLKGSTQYAKQIQKESVSFKLKTFVKNGYYFVKLTSLKIWISPDIINNMYEPWHHQMLHQTFDYWGITIAESIIDHHHGFLEVANDSEGTTYTIKLPIIRAED